MARAVSRTRKSDGRIGPRSPAAVSERCGDWRVVPRQRRQTFAGPLVARYTCGHTTGLAHRGDPDPECVACGCGALLGLLEAAA